MNSLAPNSTSDRLNETASNGSASNGSASNGTTAPVQRLSTSHAHPIIVDLGKTKKSNIEALKQGEGKLMAEVSRVIDEVRKNLGDELTGKHLVPVVILYKGKRKRRSVLGSLG